MSEQYTYAVARIRALEVSLFSDSTIDGPTASNRWRNVWNWISEADKSYLIMEETW